MKYTFRLSDHFTLNELIHSEKADELGIDNTPDIYALYCLQTLCLIVLEKVRILLNAPVVSHSGYRCPELNTKVGGQPTSQHQKGQADDFHVEEYTVKETFDKIRDSDIPYDQLIHERQNGREWVHISFDPDKQVQRHMAFQLNKT